MKDNTYKPKHQGMDDEGGGRKRQKNTKGVEGSGIKQRQPHSASVQASLSLKGFLLCPLPCPQTLNRACLIYWLGNLLNVRESVCGERKRNIQRKREKQRVFSSKPLVQNIRGSLHQLVTPLAMTFQNLLPSFLIGVKN